MNFSLFNLWLAFLWLAVGVALIAWHGMTGDPRWRIPLGGSNISLGWLAILLAVYNLVRWWSSRSYLAHRRDHDDTWTRRRRSSREEQSGPMPDTDPNLNFTESPPQPQDQRPRDSD